MAMSRESNGVMRRIFPGRARKSIWTIARARRNLRRMSSWPPSPSEITRPAYRSLAQRIAAAIDAGDLRPGDRLPPHRDLAWKLGLSVQTVSRAYDELFRAGLVAGEVGRGTFVRATPRDSIAVPWLRSAAGQPVIDVSMLMPVLSAEQQRADWTAALADLGPRLEQDAMMSFRPRLTLVPYAGLATDWLARCGLVVPAERIIATNGATGALCVALASAFSSGDEIAVEPVTHHMMNATARIFGVKLRAVAADADGMLPEALAEAARRDHLRGVYLLPSGIGPRPVIMTRERRAALAEIIRSRDLQLIESDLSGPVAARRPAPISGLIGERSWYLSTMTKSLSPGMRLGFLVAPKLAMEQALSRNLAMNWMATPLMAEIAMRWHENGTMDRMLSAQRDALASRNLLAERMLPGRTLGFRHGLHRWLELPHGANEAALTAALLDRGIAVAPGARFAVAGGQYRPAMRICLGAPSRRDLSTALRIISEIVPAAD